MPLEKVAPKIREFRIKFTEPSKTKQSFRDEVNINTIVERYNRTGEQPQGMRDATPQYGDVSAVKSYHESLNLIRESEAAFAMLPSHIRDHCLNDPAELLALACDPDRQAEAIELGIIDAPEDDLVVDPAASTQVQAPSTQVQEGGIAPAPEGETPLESK